MISVQHVSKSFGSIQAVRDVSFEIKGGEIVGFLGPNGAGKTTLMRLITGFFPPSRGAVLIDGKNLFRSDVKLRKKIGYLPEHNPLYRDMTAGDFLFYVASLKGISFWNRAREIRAISELCAVGPVLKRTIGKLSKGYQQRVGLAQALLGDPDLLILDEPTNGLDPRQILEIRTLIQVLGKKRTILISSHILPEVQMTCERIIILNGGRLVAMGTSDDLEHNLRQSEELLITVRGVGTSEPSSPLEHLPGILGIKLERDLNGERDYRILCRRGKDVRSEISKCILESGLELLSLKPAEWSLEDIFLKIVTSEQKEPAGCPK